MPIGASAALQPGTYPLINAATLSLLSGDRAAGRRDRARGAGADRARARRARDALLPGGDRGRGAAAARPARTRRGRRSRRRSRRRRGPGRTMPRRSVNSSRHPESRSATRRAGSISLRPPRSLHYRRRQGGRAPTRTSRRTPCSMPTSASASARLPPAPSCCRRDLARPRRRAPCRPSVGRRRASPRASSIRSAGSWRQRFDAALAAAESVRRVRPLDRPPDDAAVALADRIAHGAALLNAERLMGEAVQSRGRRRPPSLPAWRCSRSASAGVRGSGFEERLGRGERSSGRRRRSRARAPSQRRDDRCRLCRLRGGGGGGARGACRAARPAAAADRRPLRADRQRARSLLATLRPTGSGADIVAAIAGAAPPGSICVSDDFAAVLAAAGGWPGEANWIGEIQAYRRRLRRSASTLSSRAPPYRISSSSRCGATTTSDVARRAG